jgi:hypothetical protein
MKKLRATIPKLSLHVKPTAMIPAANCHVAALKASEIQYAMKLVTPHFRFPGGTGSRSTFVQRVPSWAKTDFGVSTWRCGLFNSGNFIVPTDSVKSGEYRGRVIVQRTSQHLLLYLAHVDVIH